MSVRQRFCVALLFAVTTGVFSSVNGRLSCADQLQPAAPFIMGYTSALSCSPGEELGFHFSGSEGSVHLRIDRVGGTTEAVFERSGIDCAAHPIPDRASSDGCGWPAAFQLTIPEDWRSGVYIATVSPDKGDSKAQARILFVVRAAAPGQSSRILLQLATNTYNAYTNWGGHSLYAYHDRDGLQGHRVSFDRPLNSQFNNWELPFVHWAESNGYVLEYAVNSDLEFHPEILKHYRLVLSIGHDEYWSSPMRDSLEAFIGDGGNVAFFSGNTCCWQVRNE
ncbi:MAG: hypothetical protein KDA96_08715, partial [Planctomycetaceae bacterium]|nr:hypothetical protein [Planctomycetaceae bacterium]